MAYWASRNRWARHSWRSVPCPACAASRSATHTSGLVSPKMLTIDVDGQSFTCGQPGWWASLDDPEDNEGQLIDEDNVIRNAARREARAKAKHSTLSPLVIRAIRESCGLSQQEAARVFGGGRKAFEKYEAGEVAPSSSMTRLLLLAARRPDLFQKGSSVPMISEADA